MYIKSNGMFWFPLVIICVALASGFLPPVVNALSDAHYSRILFVLMSVPLFLLWGIGMKMPGSGGGMFPILVPLIVVASLMTTIEQTTPIREALFMNSITTIVCSLGIIFFFGLGFGKRPVTSTAPQDTKTGF